MYKDYAAILLLGVISCALLLLFVRKKQVREAFFAFMLAQLYSWPVTLLYVQFGLQQNPVRLFPHATAGNFIFAFLFHPAIFVVYILRYPKTARRSLRVLYTAVFSLISPLALIAVSLTTNLVTFAAIWVPALSYVIILVLNFISRRYTDRYFEKLYMHGRGD